jgi:cellulose synthase/poly-beta-1,6-N-acetylglucosamine synthase-like glycosyltransferase
MVLKLLVWYDCNHSTNKCTIILYYYYIYIYIHTYLAYMFRPYLVTIRALRYTKSFKMCLKYLQYIRTF